MLAGCEQTTNSMYCIKQCCASCGNAYIYIHIFCRIIVIMRYGIHALQEAAWTCNAIKPKTLMRADLLILQPRSFWSHLKWEIHST